ncbi:MAG: citramalate synthase [Verrucomicrobiota bacterium]
MTSQPRPVSDAAPGAFVPAVTLYDTTLRDGSQGEGINFSVADKVHIAQRLDAFGMHYIEGGWPGSNDKDIEFFQRMSEVQLAGAKLAAFGSTRRANVAVEDDPQVKLLVEAGTPVVTLVAKSWLLHVEHVLRTTPEENLEMIRESVAYLKSLGREVILDAEHCFDGHKDEPAYNLECLLAAEAGGADYVVLCDTNGGTLPDEVAAITAKAVAALRTKVGIHTHDDSGLGVANALAAVGAGAVQVQGVQNGFGERTGNCNLTTTIANLQLKMGRPVLPEDRLSQLRELSLFIDEMANRRHNRQLPFVGASAFAHKGGIHVNAVNKLARSYEHIVPEAVGNARRVLVGELSGGTNVMMKAQELGLDLEEKSDVTRRILARIKQLENEGWEFEAADASFEVLVRRYLENKEDVGQFFELLEYNLDIHKDKAMDFDEAEATVKISVDGQIEHTVAEGDGPVNALDQALRKALRPHFPALDAIKLTDYKVRILDGRLATAARTRVLIESTDGNRTWSTVGVSDDIIEASWRALRDSFEYKLLKDQEAAQA